MKHYSDGNGPKDVFGFRNVCHRNCEGNLRKHLFRQVEEDGQCKEPEQGVVGDPPVLSEDCPSRSHFDGVREG